MEITTPADFELLSIDQQYYYFHSEFKKRAQGKLLVIMQDGSFFDAFGEIKPYDGAEIAPDCELIPGREGEPTLVVKGANYKAISEALQYDVCAKHNLFSVGFNCYNIDPILASLILEHQLYDEVLEVDEVSFGKKDRKVRRAGKVHTRSTLMGTEGSKYSSLVDQVKYLGILYLVRHPPRNNFALMVAGLAITSFQTGGIGLYQYHNRPDQPTEVEDDVIRFLETHTIAELCVFTAPDKQPDQYLMSWLDKLNRYTKVRFQGPLPIEHTRLDYQRQLLRKHHPKIDSSVSPHVYLGFDRSPELAATYATLLQFCYQRYPQILINLQPPVIESDSHKYLVLGNNALSQLDVLGEGVVEKHSSKNQVGRRPTESSLLDLLDVCSTAMGSRLLRDRLVTPLIDTNIIEKRYDCLEALLSGWSRYEGLLQGLPDLERLIMKLDLKLLTPNSLSLLIHAIDRMIVLFETIIRDNLKINFVENAMIEQLKDLSASLHRTIDPTIAASQNSTLHLTDNFILKGRSPELDRLSAEVISGTSLRANICDRLSELIVPAKTKKLLLPVVYIKETTTGFLLELTKKRYLILLEQVGDRPITIDEKLSLTNLKIVDSNKSGATVFISCPELEVLSKFYLEGKNGITKVLRECYLNILEEFGRNYSTFLRKVSTVVAEFDSYLSLAKVATKYNYVRPTIANDFNDRSYLVAQQLRHPLVERTSLEKYVAQDIAIGRVLDNTPSGQLIILYATNRCGKSVLARTLALLIIMSQTGCFVPATSFRYFPYKYLFTRILTKDNVHTATSSFEAELIEIRPMIEKASERTLIVADELSRGTEVDDGVALVTGVMIEVGKRGASGIFTTHLRKLATIEEIVTCEQIKIYHLECEVQHNKVVVKRNLREGPETQHYGLETASMVGLPDSVMELSYRVRRRLLNQNEQYLSYQRSPYNKKIYKDVCVNCGQPAEEHHHILEQSQQDQRGFIGHIPVHSPGNLQWLCHTCHKLIHHPPDNGQ